MKVIIIAGSWSDAHRYATRHGLTWRDWAYGGGATGCHYDRLVLAGGWHKLPDIRERVMRALPLIEPRHAEQDARLEALARGWQGILDR